MWGFERNVYIWVEVGVSQDVGKDLKIEYWICVGVVVWLRPILISGKVNMDAKIIFEWLGCKLRFYIDFKN